ncbi:MAG TPA: hypothetical protein VH395_08150 [Jatrophihabitantaceae bacterium]
MTAPDARASHRRTVIIAGCLAAVAAAVTAIAVAVSSMATDAPGSPKAAAQAWINAHLHHDDAGFAKLSCAGATTEAATFDMTVGAAVVSVQAEPARQLSVDTWTVVLDVVGPSGPAGSFPVTVEHDQGGYRVC